METDNYTVEIGRRRYVYKECPNCGGYGQVSEYEDLGGGYSSGGIGVCPKCGGKGVIKTNMFIYDYD